MNENDYECPNFHNILSKTNQITHEAYCIKNNSAPLTPNPKINDRKKKEKNYQTIHYTQPKVGGKLTPDNFIKSKNIRIFHLLDMWRKNTK